MVCAFFMHVDQLNSYIKYHQSIYNSQKATESTLPASPYMEAQLVVLLTIPQDISQLRTVLENIEKLSMSSTIPKTPSNNNNNRENAKANGNSKKDGKQKGMNSSADWVPEK